MDFRLPPTTMSLDDLERKNWGFNGFFGDFGLRHNYSVRKVWPCNFQPILVEFMH